MEQGWDLICITDADAFAKATQDGRKLRRYKRRWKVERTIAWIGNYRRVLVRMSTTALCIFHTTRVRNDLPQEVLKTAF